MSLFKQTNDDLYIVAQVLSEAKSFLGTFNKHVI